jgi:methyl-accepting chemotaxis protein
MAIDLKAQENLYTTARGVSSSAQEIGTTTEEVAATSELLAKALKDLQNNSGSVLSNIRKTDYILRFVNSIAGNSNLLGLNAAIEAARVGEYGKGLSVVAEEIRKMASDSQDAVRQINSIIELIQSSIKSIIGEIDMVSNLSERQAVAIEQIASSVQRLADSAADIEQVAREL